MPPYNHEKFLENVEWIIQNKCGGNRARFNEAVGQRSADYRWRKEKHAPRLEALLNICESFDVDLNWLLGAESLSKPEPKEVNMDELKELLAHYKELARHYKDLSENLSKELEALRSSHPTLGAKGQK